MTVSKPLRDRTIGEYIDTLATDSPAPGGGSVAGLIGALAASLGQMVIRLSVRREPSDDMSAALEPLARASETLLEWALRDESAYAGYIEAMRLPKATDEEKRARREAMEAAITNAAEIPIATAAAAVEVLEHLVPVVRFGTAHALSDAEIGASLAHASMTAALFNVRANLPLVKNEASAQDIQEQMSTLEARDRVLVSQIAAALADRRSD